MSTRGYQHTNLLATVLCFAVVILCACSNRNDSGGQDSSSADANYEDAIRESLDTDPNRILRIVDSLEKKNVIGEPMTSYYRAQAYFKLTQELTAELYYKRALADDALFKERPTCFYYACDQLSTILTCKGEQSGSIDIAMRGYARAREDDSNNGRHWSAILLHDIGYCQMRLNHESEAEKNFKQAYNTLKELAEANPTHERMNGWARVAYNILDAYTSTGHFVEAADWIPYAEEAITSMATASDCPPNVAEEYLGSLNTHKAVIYIKTGHKREADEAYRQFLNSPYSKTSLGLVDNSEYLSEAERWSERARLTPKLDSLTQSWEMPMSMYYLTAYLVPHLNAYLKSGQQHQALLVAERIVENIDSVNNYEQQHNAAELAIIYETQEKERQIAEQQTQLSFQRMAAVIAALVLCMLFLAVFMYFRQRAAKKLAEKNRELEQKNSELTVANARAEESSRMKSNFIQQISHEIRTPLNILNGFTQIMTTPDMELDEEERQNISQKITDNTMRITNLVNKMLELSDVNSKTVIELSDDVPAIEIAAKAVVDSGIEGIPGIHFNLHVDENLDEHVLLHTNKRQAARAIEMLLDNAQKFTKQGTVTLAVAQTQQQVTFTVEDSGIGVPAYEAERIFGEFVQLDEFTDGTGIGLTVARSIARRLGGDIKLDTTFKKGARFVMTLPR